MGDVVEDKLSIGLYLMRSERNLVYQSHLLQNGGFPGVAGT